VDLITYNSMVGLFASNNITVIGKRGGDVDQGTGTNSKISLRVHPASGTLFWVR
jgi:hypothetical protein